MKRRLLLTLLLLAASDLAQARIGETYQDLVKRFGQPVSTTRELRSASWDLPGVTYLVLFDTSNQSIWESIESAAGSGISDEQAEKFLVPHLSPGVKWDLKNLDHRATEMDLWGERIGVDPVTQIIYVSSDGLLFAHVDRLSRRAAFVMNKEGRARMKVLTKLAPPSF